MGPNRSTWKSGSGNELLLRLFQSDYFNVHLTVAYLKNYPDSIGITYYLIARLSQFREDGIESYWPQLCHLMISRPSESSALEAFIMRKSEESIHMAMKTLWFLQASLTDLSSSPASPSFAVCRRAFNRVQTIVFADPLAGALEGSTSSSSSSAPLASTSTKVTGSALATTVGMSLVLGAVGMPKLPGDWGRIAIEQGRKEGDASRASVGNQTVNEEREEEEEEEEEEDGEEGEDAANEAEVPPPTPAKDKGKGKDVGSPEPKKPASSPRRPARRPALDYSPGPSLLDTPPPGPAHDFRRASLGRLQPGPSSPSASPILHKPGAMRRPSSTLPVSESRRGSLRPQSPLVAKASSSSTTTQPPSSSPQPPSSSPQLGLGIASAPDKSKSAATLLPRPGSRSTPYLPTSASSGQLSSPSRSRASPAPGDYSHLSREVLAKALRCHAMRSQLDLLTSLQDISTRLVVVPKMARLSALRAELTVLNHGLPRGCCLGIYCSGEGGGPPTNSWLVDEPTRGSAHARPHHRIVRISPNESVVLNSADRAPFLLHVEVLEDDLDFDPQRRQNAEDLRRALAQSRSASAVGVTPILRHSATASLDHGLDSIRSPAGPPSSPGRRATVTSEAVSPMTSPRIPSSHPRSPLSSPSLNGHSPHQRRLSFASPPSPPEEMDLVEQLYGASSLLDDPDPTGELQDYVPKIENRAIDEEAWRRADAAKRRSASLASPTKAGPGPKLRSGPGLLNTSSMAVEAALPSRPPPLGGPAGNGGMAKRRAITLDEYAERMRMAAIMLAQLNASQQFGGAVGSTAGSAAGQLVGGALGLGASVGAGLGGAVGAGLGAVVSRLKPSPRESTPGQGSTGLRTSLDTTHAASGISALASRSSNDLRRSSSGGQGQAQGQSQQQLPPQQPRQRVLSPQESQAIKDRIMAEMMSLEEERMERMRVDSLARSSGWSSSSAAPNGGSSRVVDQGVVMRAVNKDDPSGSMLGESWAEKKARIRAASPYGHLANWNVFSVIVKTGADLRQEQLVTQLINEFGRIWREEGCPVWVRYYRILVTGESTGLMETIVDAVSLHSIKKAAYARMAKDGEPLPNYTLYDHFLETFGEPNTSTFRRAQDHFLKSLVAYSIVSYLLQLKDRHNGNILVDKHGHVVHIDFGFVLSNSPGSLGFEMAPFKLTQDYLDVLGGLGGEKWGEFRALFRRAFRDVRKHAERIITIVELMQHDSRLPCFGNGDATARQLRERFQLGLTSAQCDDFADKLILTSANSTWSRLYDVYQSFAQGVL